MERLDPALQLLLDAATDGVAVVSPDLVLTHFNRVYSSLTGKRARELQKDPPVGQCHTLLKLASCDEPEGCIARRALKAKRPLRLDEIASADGKRYIVTAVPLLDPAGAPWAVVETYRDVTAESRMQERYKTLLEAERKRSEGLKKELDEARGQLLEIFAEESREICDRIGADLVALDSAGTAEAPVLVGKLLRELHTLKGAGASAGLPELASLAHQSETLLIGHHQAGRAWDPRLGDVLLGVADAILQTSENIGRVEDVESEALSVAKARVQAFLEGGHPGQVAREPRPRRAGDSREQTVRVPALEVEALARNVGKLLDAVELGIDLRTLQELLFETRKRSGILLTAPVAQLLEPFRRSARDQARKSGRQVEVEIAGGEIRLDRRLLDGLRAPLGHLVRNAVDHGLEQPARRRQAAKPPTGTLLLKALRDASGTVLEVTDDGQGVDLARVCQVAVSRGLVTEVEAARLEREGILELLWRPGFSTAESLTESSGRGIGLDAVREQVSGLGGTISLETTPGRGTTFRIRLPSAPQE